MIGKDIMQRWYDLVPEAIKGHKPDWANWPRSTFGSPLPNNLAASAKVFVDSYYGTINSSDISEFYQPLNQVRVEWKPRGEQKNILDIRLGTVTPNFSHYRWRFDDGPWITGVKQVFAWQLHPGENWFEVAAHNNAGHSGRASRIGILIQSENSEPITIFNENGAAYETLHPFAWEDYCHPTLQSIRKKYCLDELISSGTSDLERVCLLRDWVKSRWDHDQPIVSPPWDAAYILDHTDKKIEAFYCVHYSITFMQCCLAIGIPARLINLHRGICPVPLEDRGYGKELATEPPCDEHVVNEVWIDDLGKWAMIDVDFDIHYEQTEIPLSAVEIHQALLSNRLTELTVREGPYAWKLRSSDDFYSQKLPVYYTHVCAFWRNNHLSDPNGPNQIFHWVDDQTPWMLWWQGEDLRHRPAIIGPIAISWPYSNTTPVLNDNNMASTWASSDDPTEHWIEIHWEEPQSIQSIEILWASCWGKYFNTRHIQLFAWIDHSWQLVEEMMHNQEKAVDIFNPDHLKTTRLRFCQPVGGGSLQYPNRFWVAEISIY